MRKCFTAKKHGLRKRAINSVNASKMRVDKEAAVINTCSVAETRYALSSPDIKTVCPLFAA